jgi:hypothetical protein
VEPRSSASNATRSIAATDAVVDAYDAPVSWIKRIASAVVAFFERYERRANSRAADPDAERRRRGSTFGRSGF